MACAATLALGAAPLVSPGQRDLQAKSVLPNWFHVAERLHNLPIWGRYGLVTILVLVTFLSRYTLMGDSPGYHFIFFIPAVLLSSLFLAQGSGFWAVLLSAVLVKELLLPPDLIPQEELVGLALFLGTGFVAALASEALHKAFFHLAEANGKLVGAYERIAASEQEKELLLHELTHRFKNDLANLTAILRLQARSTADPFARTELIAASERVRVMGRVHQRLTRYREMAVVNVRSFISDLCEDLRIAMIESRPIFLSTDVAEEKVPLAQAIMMGLVINELITNALKYAFPGDRAGMIRLQLSRTGDEFRLLVSDDGVGESTSTPGGSGLGQQLIQAIARQLRGTYDVQSRADGRTCTLAFPAPGLLHKDGRAG